MKPARVAARARHDPFVHAELGVWRHRAEDVVYYARATCKSHGYALAVHGSLRRDIDVVAVPWTDEACAAAQLVKDVCETLVSLKLAYGFDAAGVKGECKPLGRHAWSILLRGQPFTYLDISVAPRGRRRRPKGRAR